MLVYQLFMFFKQSSCNGIFSEFPHFFLLLNEFLFQLQHIRKFEFSGHNVLGWCDCEAQYKIFQIVFRDRQNPVGGMRNFAEGIFFYRVVGISGGVILITRTFFKPKNKIL